MRRMWISELNRCKYCRARFSHTVLVCPHCGKDFHMSQGVYLKNYFQKSLLLCVFGFIVPVFGVVLALFGLYYARQAKSKLMITLNSVAIVVNIALFIGSFFIL